jgi:hypothetical protein
MGDQYEIHFFYGHKEGDQEGWLMVATDGGGSLMWQSLDGEERLKLVTSARSAFEEPYYPGARETPGGAGNVKHVFCVTESQPTGAFTVGWWWGTHREPGEYYRVREWKVCSAPEEGMRSKERV